MRPREGGALETATMNAHIRRTAAIALVLGAAAALVPACAENESSMFISGCLLPSEDTCIVDPSGDATRSFRGTLEVSSFRASYSCPLLIGNQLAPLGDDVKLRTETSRIFVYSLEVEVRDALTNTVLNTFEAPTNGVIDPVQGSPPGFNAVDALLVDADTAASVADAGAELLVSVVAKGRTLGGTEVESNVWQFPIFVCKGCVCTESSARCQMPTEDLKADCLQGIDGHCRFVDTGCPAPGE
jgi:hypothetical protein